jgi:hypothetical protein
MFDFLSTSVAQLVFGFAGLAVLAAVGFYFIAKVRRDMTDRATRTSDLITNFQQLRDSGELSDTEYRTIKGMLAEKFTRELNGSGEKR